MQFSAIFPRRPLPRIEPRVFPPTVSACPPLRSYPGVIIGTSVIWEQVKDMAVTAAIPRNAVLYPEPDPLPPIVYLKRGKLCINFINTNGDELTPHFVLPGGITYDGFWCLGGQIRPMPLKALEDSVLFLFDSRLTFDDLLKINPLLVRNVMYSQAVKNLVYSKQALINSMRSPLEKVAFLIHEMYLSNGCAIFSPLITQKEMAFLLHIHPVTCSNALSRLRAEGLIKSFARNRCVLTDPDALGALCFQDAPRGRTPAPAPTSDRGARR